MDQDAVLERDVIHASLKLGNNMPDSAIDSLALVLNIEDGVGASVNSRFYVSSPTLTGITDVAGNGVLPPGAAARITWTIIPLDQAAPEGPTNYWIGGLMTYQVQGSRIEQPLLPAPVLVMPSPSLHLDYFHQRDVYADDPFTDEVEPSEPFALGLLVQNLGVGVANSFRITSGQPQIVENEKGLLVNFELVGAQVGAQPVQPQFTLDLGDIQTGKTAVAVWWMKSSIQGNFTNYSATFAHDDELGGERTSLIDSLSIHELTHVVKTDEPSDDGNPAFLVNDQADTAALPDVIYDSGGATYAVIAVTNGIIDAPPGPQHLEVRLTAAMPAGWGYLRINDPAPVGFLLLRVLREDGSQVRLGDNAWTTHRSRHPPGQAPYREDWLHILDKDGSGVYRLIYALPAVSLTARGCDPTHPSLEAGYTNSWGMGMTNTVSSPQTMGTSQYVCTGWVMTGNEPVCGETNWMAMTHTNDAVLVWLWKQQYLFSADSGAHGHVSLVEQWIDAGANVTVEAVADAGYRFAGWTGDVPDALTNANPLILDIDTPRSVHARFTLLWTGNTDDFEGYSVDSDPSDWFDTGANNSLARDERLFKIADLEGNKVLGTTLNLRNYHSHYVGAGSTLWNAYEYTGRMRAASALNGIGVTVFSQYPQSDAYYRLCRYKGGTFHLDCRGTNVLGGVTDTGVSPLTNLWYEFRLQVIDLGQQTAVRARMWAAGSGEPAAWQAQAFDTSSDRLTAGTIGVWSFTSGTNYWDDLAVSPLLPPGDSEGDADHDGLSDAWEWWYLGGLSLDGTGDQDSDGLTDLEEAALGTNPRLRDTDGDGLSDKDETIAGTDPAASGDYLEVDAAAVSPPDERLIMQWNTRLGRVYTLREATNLLSTWTGVYETAGDGTRKSYTNQADAQGPKYYRIDVRLEQKGAEQ